MDSDAQLLERYARDGSETAFRELVTRHINGVYRAAMRQLDGNSALAEEVTQLVFTRLAAKAGGLSAGVVLAGWLYNATHYTVANVRRAEYRRIRREQEAYRMQCDDNQNEAARDWQRLRPVLDDVLWSLKQADREAVLLRFFEERSYQEIGAALRVSEDAARMRVDRALEKLRDLLARREISSTAAAIATVLAQQTGVAAPASLASSVAQHAVQAGAAVPAGIISLMASSKPMMVAAAAGAVLCVSTGIREAVVLRAATIENASLTAEVAHQRAEVAAEERRVVAAEQARLKSRTDVGPASTAPTNSAADGSVGGATAAPDPKAAGAAFLVRHPEVKRALADYIIAGIHSENEALYRELHLTPEQIARFESVLLQGRGFGREVETGTLQFTPSDDLSPQERATRLRAILGQDGYIRYTKYEQDGQARGMAEKVASLALASDIPITPEQAATLARTFADKMQGNSFDWDRVIAEASTFLRPEHVELLERSRAQAEAWQKVIDAAR